MIDHWQEIEKICQLTLELEENQQGAFLKEARAADEKLRRECRQALVGRLTDKRVAAMRLQSVKLKRLLAREERDEVFH